MKKKEDTTEEKFPSKVTDIEAAKDNIEAAVQAFARRWIPLPCPLWPCEVMDQGQLRDAMGLHASIDIGDPWPQAEKALLMAGFRWHSLGTSRVMFLRENADAIVDDGWEEAEEISEE